MTNLELRMTVQQQHLDGLLMSPPASQDRVEALSRRGERIERRLDIVE
jgi:hypothetical protein